MSLHLWEPSRGWKIKRPESRASKFHTGLLLADPMEGLKQGEAVKTLRDCRIWNIQSTLGQWLIGG